MGKNKKNRKKRYPSQSNAQPKTIVVPAENRTLEPGRRIGASHSSLHAKRLPLPYPHSSDLLIPKGKFLRNEGRYRKAFQVGLDTSYEGFAVDLCSDSAGEEALEGESKRKGFPKQQLNPIVSAASTFPHESIRSALRVMEDAGFFRTDVTQPFGLGTKCAKTYVTRCLLGDRGTTYKYLGLRMFAHPWDVADQKEDEAKGMSLRDAISTIRELNDTLTKRTTFHLSQLDEKRQKRGAGTTRGRAKFDITLINRMENTPDLKQEPTMGDGKCSVSWHADSSLEHFSTIAVYHTIFSSQDRTVSSHEGEAQWSVALRVAHNSEGPHASRRGMDIDSCIVKDTPPIAVSLPSGSAYYLLDDFNHHHQHAVIASGTENSNGDAGIRFSSTHRLLRESHNVDFIIERCRVVCSNFHKKGPKIWRSEQLLLTEVESEWLRQYYIQGKRHNLLLWGTWGNSIRSLLGYWSQLESRTKQVVDILKAGAEGRCGIDDKMDSNSFPSRAERKMKEKRKKACATLEELLARSGEHKRSHATEDCTAVHLIYEPFATMLEERAKMRELWSKRAADHVFRELGRDCGPIPLPVDFGVSTQKGKSAERGSSPLQGTAEYLRDLAGSVRAQGHAFVTRNHAHLPDLMVRQDSEATSSGGTIPAQEIGRNRPVATGKKITLASSEHSKPSEWEGWNRGSFGLEMQSPWAEHLLAGRKTIETRAYDLPHALLGKRIDIIKSRKGIAGVSSLGNVLVIGETHPHSKIELIGWCKFSRVLKYVNQDVFEADEKNHLVLKDSGYGWKKGKTQIIYGWVVGETGHHTPGSVAATTHLAVRRMRSFFELQQAPVASSSSPPKVKDSIEAKHTGGSNRKKIYSPKKRKKQK